MRTALRRQKAWERGCKRPLLCLCHRQSYNSRALSQSLYYRTSAMVSRLFQSIDRCTHAQSIDRSAQSIDRCQIPVRMRISSVFLNMRKKNYNIMQMYIIIIPRKMASNQALPGPSTSGFSSPSESPWEVQQKEKVIN